jgi:gamma-glutamylaminecyclotransferase
VKLLFAYGTLKRGASNHAWLNGQRFIAEARTRAGFRLFDLGGYPGLVVDPTDVDGVVGEVWEIDAGCLQRLDEFEGVAEGLYRRDRITLLPPFADQDIEAYVYLHTVIGRREVGSTWRG